MTPDPATLPARLSTMLRSLDYCLRPQQIATLEEAVALTQEHASLTHSFDEGYQELRRLTREVEVLQRALENAREEARPNILARGRLTTLGCDLRDWAEGEEREGDPRVSNIAHSFANTALDVARSLKPGYLPEVPMNEAAPTIRCTDCRAEFSEADTRGAAACPACGSRSIPMSIAEDVTVRINWHELRILTIWAERWAGQHAATNPEMGVTLRAVVEALEVQRPEGFAPLMFADEVRQLAQAMNRTVSEEGGVYTLDKKEAN